MSKYVKEKCYKVVGYFVKKIESAIDFRDGEVLR